MSVKVGLMLIHGSARLWKGMHSSKCSPKWAPHELTAMQSTRRGNFPQLGDATFWLLFFFPSYSSLYLEWFVLYEMS